jgi:hypothetical protein
VSPSGVLKNALAPLQERATLPFSCPLDATSGGKDKQSAAQGETQNRPIFIGQGARSGKLIQAAAKSG